MITDINKFADVKFLYNVKQALVVDQELTVVVVSTKDLNVKM